MEEIKLSIERKINSQILCFLKKSEGTKRSNKSFKTNKIIFLIAYLNKKIIGCIPLEPRLIFYKKQKIKSFFITNAYILKKFQNLGIGTQLIRQFKKKYKLPLFAFRRILNDKTSYWYKKNKFKNIFEIISFETNLSFIKKLEIKNENINILEIKNNKKNLVIKILKNRKTNFLGKNVDFYFSNYYKNFYKSMYLCYFGNSKQYFFLTLAFTTLGDGKKRFEILDHNLDFRKMNQILIHFFKSKYYIKNIPFKIKVKKNDKIIKHLSKFYNKRTYRSNLLSDINIRSFSRFKYNSIEYV